MTEGCSRGKSDTVMDAKMQECEKRLDGLERSNAEISQKLDSLISAKPWVSDVDNKLASARIALHEEVEAIVPDTVGRVLEEKEKIEEEERAEQRAQWREEAASRMERWEQQQMDDMAEAVGMDDAQREKMEVVNRQTRELIERKTREAMEEMRNGGTFDPQTIPKVIEEVMNVQNESVKEFLSDEQFEKYIEHTENRFGRWTGMDIFGRTRREPAPEPDVVPAGPDPVE